MSDLQPYVCVFDECLSASHRFENEDDWIRHERWQHNLSWSCDGFDSHPPITFYNRGEFQLHFEACQPGLFSPPQIERLVLVSAVPVDICFGHCPFCDFAVSEEQALVTEKRSIVSLKSRLPDARILAGTFTGEISFWLCTKKLSFLPHMVLSGPWLTNVA